MFKKFKCGCNHDPVSALYLGPTRTWNEETLGFSYRTSEIRQELVSLELYGFLPSIPVNSCPYLKGALLSREETLAKEDTGSDA